MTVTMEEVLNIVGAYETDYEKESKRLGPEALEHLETLVRTAKPIIASKAAYMAALIQDERSVSILKIAAQSKFPQVRLAAANGSRHLHIDSVKDVLDLLKIDENSVVRERALKAIRTRGGSG